MTEKETPEQREQRVVHLASRKAKHRRMIIEQEEREKELLDWKHKDLKTVLPKTSSD